MYKFIKSRLNREELLLFLCVRCFFLKKKQVAGVSLCVQKWASLHEHGCAHVQCADNGSMKPVLRGNKRGGEKV